jgi:hypothetical protein
MAAVGAPIESLYRPLGSCSSSHYGRFEKVRVRSQRPATESTSQVGFTRMIVGTKDWFGVQRAIYHKASTRRYFPFEAVKADRVWTSRKLGFGHCKVRLVGTWGICPAKLYRVSKRERKQMRAQSAAAQHVLASAQIPETTRSVTALKRPTKVQLHESIFCAQWFPQNVCHYM